ncbi:MAG: hypothetical protein ACHQ49_17720 [Elusimicrobiota bacterium]
MKNVLALAISLLMPVVPVLADVVPDEAQQAAVTTKETASMNRTAKALEGNSSDAPVVAGGPATPVDTGAAPKTPPTQTDATQGKVKTDLQNDAPPPVKPEKKPSMFAKMKAKLMGFVSKHPVITGALLGAAVGLFFGGPVGMVIGACLGAVTADIARFYLKK